MGPVPPHDPPHLCVSNGVLLNGGRSSEKQPEIEKSLCHKRTQRNKKDFCFFLSHEQNSSNGVHNVDGPSEMLMEF